MKGGKNKMEKIKNITKRMNEKIKEIRESGASKLAKIALVATLATNVSAFSTVAMEKYISKMSNEQSAVINSLNAVPFLYNPGYLLGHKIFYDDENFLRTKKQITGYSDYFGRDY
jgi:hypothetical protein